MAEKELNIAGSDALAIAPADKRIGEMVALPEGMTRAGLVQLLQEARKLVCFREHLNVQLACATRLDVLIAAWK